ncbi:hypothetical protein [Amphritea japonica]|uniref:Uncharacterized protein n=1 Tax=Amphritea japonica ATCC BAA-1530 TaxID=1278309 RepID=A0A7R6PF37_9GAMM|nr:hypothetical protein [Amphritea japonica]BBB27086.1 hypothetical protein AMJAP_2497 [Amphritea japonica ATCC BAA-1530]
MPDNDNLDIMGLLLSEDVSDDIDELEQLNDLIFCDKENLPMDNADTETDQGKLIWQTENDKFAVHVWKINGKVSLKFITKSHSEYSVERLAKVALKAILEDLEKAKP